MFRLLLSLMLVVCARATLIEFPTQIDDLQAALDQSAPGDTVLVARGCWPVHLVTPDRDLTLCSNFLFSGDTTDILETQLDGELSGTVLTIRNTDPHVCRVVGFTIQRGMGMRRLDDPPHDFAGGIHIRELSAGDLQHLRFRGSRTESSAAAKAIGAICGYFLIDDEYQLLCPRAANLTSCHFVMDDPDCSPGYPSSVKLSGLDSVFVTGMRITMEADSVAETKFSFSPERFASIRDVSISGLHTYRNMESSLFSAVADSLLVVDGFRVQQNRSTCSLLRLDSNREAQLSNIVISDNVVVSELCGDDDVDDYAFLSAEEFLDVEHLSVERNSNNAGRILSVVSHAHGEVRDIRFNENICDPGTEDTLTCYGPGQAMYIGKVSLRGGEFCRNVSVAPKYLREISGRLVGVHFVSSSVLKARYPEPEGTFVFEDLLFEGNEVYDVDDPYDWWTRASACSWRVLNCSMNAGFDPCRLEFRNIRVLHNRYHGMPYEWPFDPAWPVLYVGGTFGALIEQEYGLSRGDMLVENCLFEDNDDGASLFGARHLTVRNCQYIDNNRFALRAAGNPWRHDSSSFCRVQNVFIQNTDTCRVFAGLAYDVGSQVPLGAAGDSIVVENVTLVGCDTKFLTQMQDGSSARSYPDYACWRNLLVNDCSYARLGQELQEWYYNYRFMPPFSYSCLQEEQPGEGNFVVADPRFEQERGAPFLEGNSPCVDAGDPDPDWQDLPDPEIPVLALWPGWGGLHCDVGYTGGPLAAGDPWLDLPAASPTTVADSPTLGKAYPNPFNPVTTIPFALPQAARLELSVYNLRGQLIATLAQRNFLPGEHRVTFNGSALASGVYLIRLQGEGVSQTSKLLLLK